MNEQKDVYMVVEYDGDISECRMPHAYFYANLENALAGVEYPSDAKRFVIRGTIVFGHRDELPR